MIIKKKNFLNNGFCVLKENFFNANESAKIVEILDDLMDADNSNIEVNKEVMGGRSLALNYFIDENLELKNYINKIFVDKNIINVIKDNLGENFKITDVVYRKSYPGDIGLDIHQDQEGENTIILNLSSVESCDGKTFFLKSSQRLKSIKDLIKNGSISHRLSKVFKFFLDFGDFSIGSILMFNNKVWHGRFPNQSQNISSSLLIGIYKEGSTINYDDHKNVFQKIKNKLDFKYELDVRRNLEDNLIKNKGLNSYQILSSNLEKNNNNNLLNKISLKTKIYVFLIKIIYILKGV